jgi:uncharacterized zinc-type alcohol dehydrogenase-like protein
MSLAKAYAALNSRSPLVPFQFSRREPRDRDVSIAVEYCGICHTDLHQVGDDWGRGTGFPMVPGHEIVGRVTQVGRGVRKFKVGDAAGVGCMVDSCRKCANCKRGLEQHCSVLTSFTYGSVEQDGKTPTQGGYSSHIVVDEDFALKIAEGLPLERVAPLLCAGITTYSPLKRYGVGKGDKVAVLGLGGLGHMAVKLAAAMGAEVTVLSGSPAKKTDALRLGAHEFALTGPDAAKLAGRFGLIIDTVSGKHDVNAVLGTLATEGALVMVGASPEPHEVGAFALIGARRSISGTLIGGIAETQEMLDFCAKRGVLADVEVTPISGVNEAFARLAKGDVRFRFSLDLKTL